MRIMRLGRVCRCVADASWWLPSKMRRLLYGVVLGAEVERAGIVVKVVLR